MNHQHHMTCEKKISIRFVFFFLLRYLLCVVKYFYLVLLPAYAYLHCTEHKRARNQPIARAKLSNDILYEREDMWTKREKV